MARKADHERPPGGLRMMQLRLAAGFTSAEKFAEELGYERTAIAGHESGKKEAGRGVLAAAARRLNVHIDDLVWFPDETGKGDPTEAEEREREWAMLAAYRKLPREQRRSVENITLTLARANDASDTPAPTPRKRKNDPA